jgi:hypothetical protein
LYENLPVSVKKRLQTKIDPPHTDENPKGLIKLISKLISILTFGYICIKTSKVIQNLDQIDAKNERVFKNSDNCAVSSIWKSPIKNLSKHKIAFNKLEA